MCVAVVASIVTVNAVTVVVVVGVAAVVLSLWFVLLLSLCTLLALLRELVMIRGAVGGVCASVVAFCASCLMCGNNCYVLLVNHVLSERVLVFVIAAYLSALIACCNIRHNKHRSGNHDNLNAQRQQQQQQQPQQQKQQQR